MLAPRATTISLIIAVTFVGTSMGNGDDQLSFLQGEWVANRVDHHRGDAITDPSVCTLTITDDGFASCGEWKGTIRVRPNTKPAQMDITLTEGPWKGKVSRAIYKVMGDTLIVCCTELGGKRPKQFNAKAPGAVLIMYQKVREKE